MEIRDYLRAIRRWLWLPIVVPLVAALITGGVLEMQPSHYEANATVIVPAVSAKGFSTSAAAQYVATFKDVLVSSPVVNKVAAENHVPTSDLVNGLSATTVTASSNIIHITYIGLKGQNTTGIVDDASILTLDTVAEPELVQAQNAVSAAQVQLQQANAAINNFNTTTGNILPQQQFTSQQQELDTLLLELQQANLAGDTTHATALQSIITQREQQLATLAGQVNQYTALSDARQAAISVSDHAAQELNDVEFADGRRPQREHGLGAEGGAALEARRHGEIHGDRFRRGAAARPRNHPADGADAERPAGRAYGRADRGCRRGCGGGPVRESAGPWLRH